MKPGSIVTGVVIDILESHVIVHVGLKSEAAIKDAGKLRVEGKDYVVQDGDIMHFRFNV